MTTKTPAQHLETLKAHNACRRGATRKLEASPEGIGEAIDYAIGVMEAQTKPVAPLNPHVIRQLVNDVRDLAKQYHDHDSLRDRISVRLREDVQPNEAQAETPIKRKPTGFVAICQCGLIVGAMDFTRTDKKDAGKILGDWLAAGCAIDPRFSGDWEAHVEPCRCRTQSAKSED